MERVQQSNEACQRGDFQAAVSLYGDALRADPQNCILYSNRSAALLKLGRYQASLDDAVKACLLNPKWPKVMERHLLDISNFFNKSKTEKLGVQNYSAPLLSVQQTLYRSSVRISE
uniref:Tetratricopeptide repeat protein 28 n=1 Tax=Oncorhynchus mykiss TaxID=8022 RepID=A0A8C7NDI5_ONCMY